MSSRIGLIVPSSNRLSEPQFHRYLPAGVDVHVTRLRMTGKWRRPLAELGDSIVQAACMLADVKPQLIVFHCTSSSMEDGLAGEARIVDLIREATGCPAITTARAITEALQRLAVKKLVLISPYDDRTHQHEVAYVREAGFELVHDIGLQEPDTDAVVSSERWIQSVSQHRRADADGYLLSCTNTTVIEVIEECERFLGRPVVTSNQATLWACLQRLGIAGPVTGLGRLLS